MTIQTPYPPGELGGQVSVEAIANYLADLDNWVKVTRIELDEIDQRAQISDEKEELTRDIRLVFAIWQAIRSRMQKILTIWDGGRVGVQQNAQILSMIWGRIDEGVDAAQGLSLPEAGRLCDALSAQLRSSLHLSSDDSQAASKIRALRVNLERIRDQITYNPPPGEAWAVNYFQALTRRVEDLTTKAARGADVGGLVGSLEIDLARFERDLIVHTAEIRQEQPQYSTAQNQRLQAPGGQSLEEFVSYARQQLSQRQLELAELIEKAVASLADPPNLALPNVAALGEIPASRDALESYLRKLARVEQALDIVEEKYCKALTDAGFHVAPQQQKDQSASDAQSDQKLQISDQDRNKVSAAIDELQRIHSELSQLQLCPYPAVETLVKVITELKKWGS